MEWEPRKILGALDGDALRLAAFRLSAHCNRVAVSDGHTLSVSVELERSAPLTEVAEALASYAAPAVARNLPSAPRPAIYLHTAPDRPQPRLDRWIGKGMSTVVGRVRPDPLFDVNRIGVTQLAAGPK